MEKRLYLIALVITLMIFSYITKPVQGFNSTIDNGFQINNEIKGRQKATTAAG